MACHFILPNFDPGQQLQMENCCSREEGSMFTLVQAWEQTTVMQLIPELHPVTAGPTSRSFCCYKTVPCSQTPPTHTHWCKTHSQLVWMHTLDGAIVTAMHSIAWAI